MHIALGIYAEGKMTLQQTVTLNVWWLFDFIFSDWRREKLE